MRRVWWALGFALAALAAVAAWSLLRDKHVARPPAAEAYAAGGAPPALPDEVTRIFKEAFPDYLIALDAYAEARRIGNQARAAEAEGALARAREEVLRPEGLKALGPKVASRLEEVVARARQVAEASGEEVEAAGDGLLASVGALDDELAAAGIGVFLDGDILDDGKGRRMVIAYAFTVTEVRRYRHGDDTVRALRLRRLDKLNYEQAVLGFTRPNLRQALVLLDQVDDTLVNQVLPAMADGARFRIVESTGGGDFAEREEVERRAGAAVRADLGKLVEGKAAARMGTALGRRREIFEGWNRRLAARGIVLPRPTSLRLDRRYLDELAQVVSGPELDQLRILDGELGGDGAREVLRGLADPLIESVERHEVQHRLDGAAGGRRMPDALRAYVGEGGLRAREELSAHLAELSRGPGDTTRLELALLSHALFDRDAWGTAECWAAVTIFEGLYPDDGPLVGGGEIDRAKAARMFYRLLDRPEADVRRDAGALWERLFGLPLPAVVLAD